ncbi:phosphate ABC transporter substrate-binding protein [Dehalococcoidia bacterium]|nr:phosphate ABC transporter substrate-binding protein [Dehalococcoidia bacterium]
MKKGVLSSLLVVLLLATSVVAIGCPPEEEDPPAEDPVEERLVVGGSSSVYVVAVLLAERFMEKHPHIVVETHSVGSTAGVVGAHEGTFDIGMSSRWLKGDEPGWGLGEFVICHDAIAAIVHPDNPVENLTMEEVRKIFLGEITNWNEVGGKDVPITVIIREEGSGTRGAFEDIVHEDIEPVPTLIKIGTGGVRAAVAGDPSAIGYITIAALDETVRALKVDGVAPTAAAVLAGDYGIARPFLFLTYGEPDPLERKFIDFVLGPEGQDMLADEGMVRVD